VIWQRLKHFTKDENWGDPDKINGYLLLCIDAIRDIYGKSFVIHCGYDKDGHALASEHYKGNAIDFHIEDDIPLYNQVMKFMKIVADLQLLEKVGVGIYPNWNSPGFHFDVRGSRARWGKLDEYVSFTRVMGYMSKKR